MESDTGSVIESSDNGISLLRRDNGIPVYVLKKKPKKVKKKKEQKAPFKCQHCNEEFPNYDVHAKHVETVHPVPHACAVPNCYYRTARKWYMRAHIKKVHGPNAIKCPIDGCEGYFVKRVLQKHVKTFHKNKGDAPPSPAKLQKTFQKCCYCDYETESSKLFEHHSKDFHLNGLPCPVEGCEEKIFADKLDSHFNAQHAGVEYEYSLGKGIKLKEATEREETNEIAAEAGEEQLEKENSDMDLEYEHASTAAGFDGFQCQKCSKSFMLRRALIKHITAVHEKKYKKYERTKKFPCTFENCNKSFTCQTLLDDHLNMHNGNYAYKCDNCSEKFFARARYAVHLTKFHNKSIKDFPKNAFNSDVQMAMASC